ncbi:MAG: glycoside hydrolase family 3 protein, partial [Parachlamydiaceae bacterium]
NMTLGAIQNEDLIFEMGKEVGRECKAIGISLNLSPDVDVNNNPLNPVIGIRSFGDDSKRVAKLGLNMMRGIKSAGVKTTAKHFPGHGNVVVDSHSSLPVTNDYDLYPFIELIQHEVDCILTAHLLIPSVDAVNPVSLSKKWIDLLKEELHFKGLIITDDLLMKALESSFGDRALRAFLAGNHLLLFTENLHYNRKAFIEGYEAIYNAVLDGLIPIEMLNERVKEIIAFKRGLSTTPSYEPWITPNAIELKNRLFREAITKVNDYPIEEPIQIVTNPLDPIFGKTILYAGSPYHLPLLPKDRAIVLAYEPAGIEQALIAIKENDFRGRLPIKQ